MFSRFLLSQCHQTLTRCCTVLAVALLCSSGLLEGQIQRPTPGVPKEGVTTEGLKRYDSTLSQNDKVVYGFGPMFQVAAALDEARTAENAKKNDVAAHKIAWSIVATRNYTQRDTLHMRLRNLVRAGAWGPIASNQVESAIDHVLDSLFQSIYDRSIAVVRSEPTSSRVVLGEYLTGMQCGVCWTHDRYFAALQQRYPRQQLVVVGYHDGPGYPIAHTQDSMNKYIGGIDVETGVERPMVSVYRQTITNKKYDNFGDWIDGVAIGSVFDLMATMESRYQRLVDAIDVQLRRAPGAHIALSLTPKTNRKVGLSAIDVNVQVTPLISRERLGLRLVLVQDTVRVTGYSPRRLHYMAARAIAWFGPKQMFYALPANSTQPATVHYRFDITALQRDLLEPYITEGADQDIRLDFPARQDWLLNTKRLGVVAIVQDRVTKEVLHTAYQPLN